MFEGFTLDRIDVGEAVLRVRHGGSGPPVLLLHGHPRTHATWHRVAPQLADEHTVVCPDLRGYGESSKPPTKPDHEPHSKRAMARDCVAVMHALGHDRFAVVGHDRGGYVAQRAALDHPRAVSRLGVLDVVPIGEALARCTAAFAQRWWHWFFFAQPDKPARAINADPDAWYGGDPERMGSEAYADYHRAIHDPATVHAMMEDYRAGLGIDRANDDADRHEGATASGWRGGEMGTIMVLLGFLIVIVIYAIVVRGSHPKRRAASYRDQVTENPDWLPPTGGGQAGGIGGGGI